MYFDTTTESSSLHLPFNTFDVSKKDCFRQTNKHSDGRKLNTALPLFIAIVIIITSSTGVTFGVRPSTFTTHIPDSNEINDALMMRSSVEDEEHTPLRNEATSLQTKQGSTAPPLTYAHSEPIEEDRQHYAEVFRQWDLPEDEYEDKACDEDMARELCPVDASVSCGSIAEVERFCKALLGETIVGEMHFRTSKTETDALEGCKNYVSYNRGSCCHSGHCHFEHDDDGDYDEEHEL